MPEDQDLDVIVLFGDVLSAVHMPGNSSSHYVPDNGCPEGISIDIGPDNSSHFQFQVSADMTPIVSSIQQDDASMVTVSHNRGHFQGTNLPSFVMTGSGFGGNASCQNQIMIGSSSCDVTDFSESTLSCSVANPLSSETDHPIQLIRSNHGYGAIDNINSAKYYAVSSVSSISPAQGSKGGGNILTVTGSGFISHDDVASVIFVGPDQTPQECMIQNKTDTEIKCKVPTAYMFSFQDVINATVFIRIGQLQYPPAQADGDEDTFAYMFMGDLSPKVDSLSEGSAVLDADLGSMEIFGSGFGNDSSNIMVSLVAVDTISNRIMRDVKIHEHHQLVEVEHKSLNQLHMSPFFHAHLSRKHVTDLKWKVGGSGAQMQTEMRNFEKNDIHKNPLHSGVALVFEDDHQLDSDLALMEEENYLRFVHRHKRSIMTKRIQKHRRSINSHVVFRQAEIDEPTLIEGTVTDVSDNTIEATFNDIPAGDYILQVTLLDVGNALNNVSLGTVTSQGSVNSIVPSEGSIMGGQQVTINGIGFHSIYSTRVTIDGIICELTRVEVDLIECITGSKGVESLDAVVTIESGGSNFPNVTYNYSSAATPMITTFSSSSGIPGNYINVSGTFLDTDTTNYEVILKSSITSLTPTIITILPKSGMKSGMNYNCTVISVSDSVLQFEIPEAPGGTNYSLSVLSIVDGFAQIATNEFDVELGVSSIAPSSGSKGGGSLLVLTGYGFDTSGKVRVTVCDNVCNVDGSVMTDTINCFTPPDASVDDVTSCLVQVFQLKGFANATSPSNFTYMASLTPTITTVLPNSGGSGGGTRINITGQGFDSSSNTVSIDGSPCVIVSQSETEIICDTESHAGSGTFSVDVEVPGKGNAALPGDGNGLFKYVDRWSSIWTWGGLGIPQEGEFIVIEAGQEIVLDVTTPTLSFFLLNGGHLIFEREEDNLVLNSEFILLLNDGILEIGTEEEPYLNTATIMLHGNVRCIELPIYGCKVLGVRKGFLELHGKPVNNTWTHLAVTAEANATEITVIDNVSDWEVGDEIIIPSTNNRHSMGENEKCVVSAISGDGKTLTLAEPLKYKHISISQTFGTTVVETRAEVGRITRNVKYQGSRQEEFIETIPACEKKFDSNQFASQSCFNGKFGEELGSDEFGAVTLYAVKNKNMFEAQIHLSYVEFFWVGQAFRVGRYPIHFHMMGNVTGSYARGCAVHNSFNRAMTIHGITGVLAEQVVTYDIKGLSFFIEDGIEENNIVRRNLAVYTRQSSSLLNPDVTPASYWIVNPNNQIYENAAAGGTHFGFWFRIQRHPDGPSETTSYCSNNVPLGVFRDNSAHTFGWYGLWIFSMDGYFPKDGTPEQGYCDGGNDVPAVFERCSPFLNLLIFSIYHPSSLSIKG